MQNAFEDCPYLPLLSLKPAEMNALQNLPEQTKDDLLPLFFFRRWASAHRLESSVARIEEAFGDRPALLEVTMEPEGEGARRQVHDELDDLREPDGGYANWQQFIAENERFIPVLQLTDVAQLGAQAAGMEALGRGLVIRVPAPAFGFIGSLAQALAGTVQDDSNVCFIIDFERQDRFLLNRQTEAVGFISTVRDHLPGCIVSVSATSFPDSFTGIAQQDIFERLLFEGLKIQIGGHRLLYSDRGSARAEALGGGGGEIPPRVDYVTGMGWSFFRADTAVDRLAQYQAQATEAMESDAWDDNLHVWGTQLIERTAAGEPNAIYSQATAAAARINIHLHRQQYFGSDDVYDTDEGWSD